MKFIDSHTGGEPTRVLFEDLPQIRGESVREKRDFLEKELDWIRTASVCEPRGSEVLVGAILVEPSDPAASFGVVFFNTAGYLGMCGHGTIGFVETLRHLGRLPESRFSIETPVGLVEVTLEESGNISLVNVPCRLAARDVEVEVPGVGRLTGDIAYGGNWFFLCENHGRELVLSDADKLVRFTGQIMDALEANRITGDDGGKIDHVELFGPPQHGGDSQNFVLCPGKAYDRSPCGTGTSAKMASLHARGKIEVGMIWRQESITGSIFEASVVSVEGNSVRPRISGRAFIMAEGRLIIDPTDPFGHGIGRSRN